MVERELKFHVPARQRAGLTARLQKLGAEPIELHARYYDTDDQELARAGIALRLRREGNAWVQTIKTPGADELSRIEWNHPRPEPVLDLSVYDDTHIGPLISRLADRLVCRYITHVTRLKKVISTGSGTAELAYDEGVIMAGEIELPIHELEIEALSGPTEDLFSTAQEWLQAHRLILELRSKAARGDALASLGKDHFLDVRHGVEPGANAKDTEQRRARRPSARHIQRLAAPVRAGQPQLPPDAGMRSAYLQCANDCMSQIVRNSAFLAGVDGMKTSVEQRIEYVHQIRVGIRRLRTCWKLFGNTATPPEPLQHALKEHFRVWGQTRDNDVIQTELLPRLMHAGMPPDAAASDKTDDPDPTWRARMAASTEFQLTLLSLVEHLVCYGDSLEAAGPGKTAGATLCKRLNTWLQAIRRQTPGFLEASWDERHKVRKRVKRLRYGLEFAQGTLDASRLTPLRNALVSAQKALGQLNDLYLAAEYYRGPGARHPSAMFALGWLAATQEHEAQASYRALHELAGAGRFHASGKRRKHV